MKRSWLVGLLSTITALGFAAQARAQGGIQYNPRPTVSPYLNLARPGNPGVNYFALVRPQLQTAKTIQQLQQEIRTVEGAYGNPVAPPDPLLATAPTTGHPVAFGNLSRYYPGFNRATGGAGIGGFPGGNTGGTINAFPIMRTGTVGR